MKKYIISLATIAMTFAASAQFVSGPATGPSLLISGAFFLPGATTTNLPDSVKFNIPIGSEGIGLFFHAGATNAASTTNATIILEQSVNGTDWHTAPTFSVSFPQSGSTPNWFYTNMLPTSVNLGNARFLRFKSIQNTNVLGIFLTNALWSVKE